MSRTLIGCISIQMLVFRGRTVLEIIREQPIKRQKEMSVYFRYLQKYLILKFDGTLIEYVP